LPACGCGTNLPACGCGTNLPACGCPHLPAATGRGTLYVATGIGKPFPAIGEQWGLTGRSLVLAQLDATLRVGLHCLGISASFVSGPPLCGPVDVTLEDTTKAVLRAR
jgi:hypothetical protein